MTLDQRWRDIDGLRPPDLWSDIERRAALDIEPRPTRVRPVFVLAAAVAALLLAAGLGVLTSDDADDAGRVVAEPGEKPGPWRRLPRAGGGTRSAGRRLDGEGDADLGWAADRPRLGP